MTRRCLVLLLALALPLAAQAQVTAVSRMTDSAFSEADCDSDDLMQVTFTYVGTPSLSAQYSIFAVNANSALGTVDTLCAATPSSGGTLVDTEPLPLDSVVDLPTDHEISIGEFLQSVCNADGFRGERYLCLRVTDGISTYGTGSGLVFSVDTQVPDTPTEATWQGGDGSVILADLTVPGGTSANETLTYIIELRPCTGGATVDTDAGVADASAGDAAPEDGGGEDAVVDASVADSAQAVDAATSGSDAGASSLCSATASFSRAASGVQLPLRVSGLTNGSSYEVRARVQDGAGNQSGSGAQAVVVPQPEFGFWDLYQGAEQGSGCTSCTQGGGVAGGWLGLWLALPLAWRRRRQLKALRPLALAIALLAAAGSARAETFDLAVHVGGGPYHPDIDSESGANDVYRCVFDDKIWVLGTGGLDLVLFDLFGTLSVGGEIGYFTVGGRERLSLGSNGSCGTASSSTNTLHMLPLSANLHYRFDWPYQMWGFPFAPYGRIGLNATPWAITRNGTLDQTGGPITGVRTGWQWAVGVAFVLDVIDQASMTKVRESGAFQHAYLFAEWRDLRIDSFGEPGFVLGNTTWLAGVALDL